MNPLRRSLERPIDIAWLSIFRVLFGLTMCFSLVRFIAYQWIDIFFVKPKIHFKYWAFSFVEVLSPPAMHGLFYVLAALALAVAVGFCFRACALLFALGFTYLQLVDVTTYLNHYYLASLLSFLLAFSPAHRAFSIDAWLRPKLGTARIAAFWLYLFRFQVGVVYTFAGLAKATSDWLLHAEPLRIWLGSRTGMPILGSFLALPWAAPLMSWAGFLFDTTIVWFLLARKTRPFAYVAVIAFHVLTRLLFPIGMFPFIMVLGALVFFAPGWPRKGLAYFSRWARWRQGEELPTEIASAPATWAYWLAGTYVAVQLLLPLRHLAYGGNVLWDEQGMRFSWRVMVREKNGAVTYRVHSPQNGRTVFVDPSSFLTRIQERELSSQPDLILQLAHHLKKVFAERGWGQVEVRADALVSLNGRRTSPLIDPTIDLGQVEDGLGKADWIMPAPAGPPPRLRMVK